MKVIEDVLLKRTSVRRYEREKIEPEKLDLIYRAMRLPTGSTTMNIRLLR